MKKSSVFDFFINIFAIYGVTVIILSMLCLTVGEDAKEISTIFSMGNAGLGANTCMQFLLMAVLVVSLRWIFFTDWLMKRWSMIARMVGMIGVVILLVSLFAAVFGWFPLDMPKAWIAFLLSFFACAVVSTAVSVAKEKSENKKLQAALDKLKECEE